MASEPLRLTLRPRVTLPEGLAPAGEVRDQQAERKRALAKATGKALAALEPQRKYAMTAWTKGDASDTYKDLQQSAPLLVALKPASVTVETASIRQRRMAAAIIRILRRRRRQLRRRRRVPCGVVVVAVRGRRLPITTGRWRRRREGPLLLLLWLMRRRPGRC